MDKDSVAYLPRHPQLLVTRTIIGEGYVVMFRGGHRLVTTTVGEQILRDVAESIERRATPPRPCGTGALADAAASVTVRLTPEQAALVYDVLEIHHGVLDPVDDGDADEMLATATVGAIVRKAIEEAAR